MTIQIPCGDWLNGSRTYCEEGHLCETCQEILAWREATTYAHNKRVEAAVESCEWKRRALEAERKLVEANDKYRKLQDTTRDLYPQLHKELDKANARSVDARVLIDQVLSQAVPVEGKAEYIVHLSRDWVDRANAVIRSPNAPLSKEQVDTLVETTLASIREGVMSGRIPLSAFSGTVVCGPREDR